MTLSSCQEAAGLPGSLRGFSSLSILQNIACLNKCRLVLPKCILIFCKFSLFQGKGLFAKRSIKKGETIFIERPLVSAQFLWNALYKYKGEMLVNTASHIQRTTYKICLCTWLVMDK